MKPETITLTAMGARGDGIGVLHADHAEVVE